MSLAARDIIMQILLLLLIIIMIILTTITMQMTIVIPGARLFSAPSPPRGQGRPPRRGAGARRLRRESGDD